MFEICLCYFKGPAASLPLTVGGFKIKKISDQIPKDHWLYRKDQQKKISGWRSDLIFWSFSNLIKTIVMVRTAEELHQALPTHRKQVARMMCSWGNLKFSIFSDETAHLSQYHCCCRFDTDSSSLPCLQTRFIWWITKEKDVWRGNRRLQNAREWMKGYRSGRSRRRKEAAADHEINDEMHRDVEWVRAGNREMVNHAWMMGKKQVSTDG